jgi:predicted Zn-dependent protease
MKKRNILWCLVTKKQLFLSKKWELKRIQVVTRRLFKCLLAAFLLLWQMGMAAFADGVRLIQDAETQSILQDLTQPIFKIAGLECDAIKIYLVADDSLNAFVYGGQNIFINTGLIKFSSSPETVVGVIAHEVGHIVGGHLIHSRLQNENATRQSIIGFIAGGILGVAAGSTDVAMGAAHAFMGASLNQSLAFSRAQESAADATSAKILNQLKVPSAGLVTFLKDIAVSERVFYSGGSLYHRTHPLSSSRIQFLQRTVQAKNDDTNYLTPELRKRFATVHAKISAFTASSQQMPRILRQFSGTNLQYADIIAKFRMNQFAYALDQLGNLISKQPDNPYLHELKGEILFTQGNVKQASEAYRKAYLLKPQSEILALMYASVLIKQGEQLLEARNILRKLISQDRSNVSAWQELARIYQQQRKQASLHLCLGFEAYLKADNVTAQKHLNALKMFELQLDAQEKQMMMDLKSLLEEKSAP